MAIIKLTDRAILAAKAKAGERMELWDENTPGLCLRVSGKAPRTGGDDPKVKKVWIWRYRAADGRQPRLTLGDYSAQHGLKWARERVEGLRVQVRDPKADPAADRRKAKVAAKAQKVRTFDELADAYLTACENGHWKPRNKQKRERSLEDERGVLRRHIRPVLGKERFADITRRDVRAFLRGMIDKGIGAQTNKAHQVIRQVFNYAVAEELVVSNPATGFLPLATVTPKARTLSDAELKALWAGLQDPGNLTHPPAEGQEKGDPVGVSRAMAIILQLSTLLMQRRAEITGMRVDELDLEQSTWLIPAERMKGNVAHLVPLPALAVKLVKEALKIADEGAERRRKEGERQPLSNARPVFPSPRSPTQSVLPNSVTHAMKDITTALGIEGVSPHDLRRTGSTALTSERIGVSPFIRSKVLGHSTDSGGGAAVSSIHYDANSYIAEKRRALEAWEALLLEIISGQARPSNVRQIAGAAQ
jgi:integrase